jgi:hypothetical protein
MLLRICFFIPAAAIPPKARGRRGGATCSGCGKKEKAPATVVTWPELVHFDEVLRETESLVAERRVQETLEKRITLLEAGWAVAPSSVPANVANMEKVRPLLGDLVSKLNGLAVSQLSSVKLGEIVTATRPILNELFEAIGVARP